MLLDVVHESYAIVCGVAQDHDHSMRWRHDDCFRHHVLGWLHANESSVPRLHDERMRS